MSDDYLHERTAGVEPDRFDKLAESFYVPLTVFAFKIIGDRQAAEDVAQDALVNIWQKRKSLKGVSHMRNYLYLTVHNYSVDYCRRNSKSVPLYTGGDIAADDISANFIKTETVRQLYEAVDSLPGRTSQVIRLTLEGMKQDEIAREMGITIATVKALKSDGLKKLKKVLGAVRYLMVFSKFI